MRLVLERARGQLDESVVVEGVEDRGHGLHRDDEAGDGAGRDDPAVGDGDVDAGGELPHDGDPGEERVGAERLGRWGRLWWGIRRYIIVFENGDCGRRCDCDGDEDDGEDESVRLPPDVHDRPLRGPGRYVSHFLPLKRISSSYNPSLAEPVGILCSYSRNNISELNAISPRKNPDRAAAVHITAQRTGWLEGHAISLAPTKKHANGPNALCTPTFRVYLSRRAVDA